MEKEREIQHFKKNTKKSTFTLATRCKHHVAFIEFLSIIIYLTAYSIKFSFLPRAPPFQFDTYISD